MLLAEEHRRTIEIFLSATLFSTNLTWSDLDSNLDLRGERSATNRVIQAQLSKAFAPPFYSQTSLLIRAVHIEICQLDILNSGIFPESLCVKF
jgi:hypothetical protein